MPEQKEIKRFEAINPTGDPETVVASRDNVIAFGGFERLGSWTFATEDLDPLNSPAKGHYFKKDGTKLTTSDPNEPDY